MHPIVIPALFLAIFIILITSSFFTSNSKTRNTLYMISFGSALLSAVSVVVFKINQDDY